MDEELEVDPAYQKGFNGGYTLAKEDPELLKALLQSKNDHSQYFQGLKAGGREYLREKFKDELQRDREKIERSVDKNKEREKE
ncbi:hypothetical protein [Rurimicrobium arvi]|uniref:Uncharacterized protein n=1 Tax=Rurimicrobium arvi TaxID=2049916 RepID=A0ABP8N122_9BACT